MSNCCPKLGLLKDIGPIIEGLRSENDRMATTFAIMALIRFFNDHHSNFLVGVKIVGNTLTFTRNDGTTIDVEIPIPSDEYVNGAYISNKKLILLRNLGLDLQIDLSSIIPEIPEVDTSMFFASCELIGNTIIFKNKSGDTILGSVNINDTYIIDGGLILDQTDNNFYILLDYNREGIPSVQIPLNNLCLYIINKIPFIPGYYKSKSYLESSEFNTLSTLYLGTTWDPNTDKPTSTYKYIYKVISKRDYKLVASYKIPRPGYFYVVTSGNNIVKYNILTSGSNFKEEGKKIPGGVIGIIKQGSNGLEIERLDNYFIYIEPDINNSTSISSITYNNIIDDPNTYVITSLDIQGNIANAEECMFYPSRFGNSSSFKGKYDWLAEGVSGANALALAFNDLLSSSGYTQIYEIYKENDVDNVNIIGHDKHNVNVINGDRLEGLRYTNVRLMILEKYIGKASYNSNTDTYVAGGPNNGRWLPDNLLNSDHTAFSFVDIRHWKNKETLEIIWSYIITSYFNSTNPEAAISSVCYSDATGWFTTWSNLSMINTGYGFVINANTECRDCEVVNPGNGKIPEIGSDNMPCSSFVLTFDILTIDANINGVVNLNVGGRKWDNTNYPYRYVLHSKHYDENVELYKQAILFKTTLKDCNFIILYNDGNNLVSEHVKYNKTSGEVDSQVLTSAPNSSSYITDVSENIT